MKVLYLDIETRAAVVNTWGLWNQNIGINQVDIPPSMICFAAKWQGDKKVEFFSDFHDGHEAMVRAAHALVHEADVLVTWNGRRFDEKHLNREFLELGLLPPSPYKSLDLMQAGKKKFLMLSNKLDWYAGHLLDDHKVAHQGFGLWKRCLAGEASAWAEMREYNRKDVTLLEDLHERLLPWIDSHPNVALHDGADEPACPNCGGTDLRREGFSLTAQGKYQRYQCKGCGKWLRGTKRVDKVERVEAR